MLDEKDLSPGTAGLDVEDISTYYRELVFIGASRKFRVLENNLERSKLEAQAVAAENSRLERRVELLVGEIEELKQRLDSASSYVSQMAKRLTAIEGGQQ